MEILNKVKKQYELFPYPQVSPLSWLGRIQPHSQNSFERGHFLTHHTKISHNEKKIALFGCGTQEAVAFATHHKKAQIYACDLSQKSLALSKLHAKISGVKNIKYFCQDLVMFADEHPQEFDYIHAFGVLHHLENSQKGFNAIEKSLKPDGFARIMVYSQTNRKKISHLQKVLKKMGFGFDSPNFEKEVKTFIQTIPFDNPLRLAFELHTETKSKPGLVDAFLHANEKSFYLSDLLQIIDNAKLKIAAWDFSPQILRILSEVDFLKTIEEKIELLEATEQWPAHFTFWVVKK